MHLPTDDDLISDLKAVGFRVITFAEPDDIPQADRDYFTVVAFLEFCIRLTGERFLVNPSIAAHFLYLRIPSNLFDISEYPDHGTSHLSFNSVPREADVDRT